MRDYAFLLLLKMYFMLGARNQGLRKTKVSACHSSSSSSSGTLLVTSIKYSSQATAISAVLHYMA